MSPQPESPSQESSVRSPQPVSSVRSPQPGVVSQESSIAGIAAVLPLHKGTRVDMCNTMFAYRVLEPVIL